MKLTRETLAKYIDCSSLDDSDLGIVREMALQLMAQIPATEAPAEAVTIKGDRFANDNGQYVIAGDSVYALMTDLKWHHRHPLPARDRATLRLIERGFVIPAHLLAVARHG